MEQKEPTIVEIGEATDLIQSCYIKIGSPDGVTLHGPGDLTWNDEVQTKP